MKLKIQAIKRKEMPSSFGGTWTIVSVKFEGMENPEYGYDLNGFGKFADKFKVGDTIQGYFSTQSYVSKKDGLTKQTKKFNKITAEYVYDLLLKINPAIESIPGAKEMIKPVTQPIVEPVNDGWGQPEESIDEPGF